MNMAEERVDVNKSENHQASSVQLLELPPEMIDEIMKRLDPVSLNNLRNTCKLLRVLVENFKLVYKAEYEEMIKQQRAYVDDVSDEEFDDDEDAWFGGDGDYQGYAYNNDPDDYLINDMLDRLSCGSNYDSDLDELLNNGR